MNQSTKLRSGKIDGPCFYAYRFPRSEMFDISGPSYLFMQTIVKKKSFDVMTFGGV